MIKKYSDKEFDFAIRENDIAYLTGLPQSRCNKLIKLLSRDPESTLYVVESLYPTLLTFYQTVSTPLHF